MLNPFQVPDTARGAKDPLCPWRFPEHLGWYVDVDSTGSEYQRFLDLIDIEGLKGQGRVILVMGESGCGKTSLAHRCAHYIDSQANRDVPGYKFGDLIVDLNRHEYSLETAAQEQARISEVCAETLRYLQEINTVPVQWKHVRHDDYRNTYRQLSQVAKSVRFTLIVLVPPSDDYTGELREYMFLARTNAGLVFITESSLPQEIRTFVDLEKDRSDLIDLEVGMIRHEDAWSLVRDRLERYSQEQVAQITKEELDRAVKWLAEISPISIRRIGRMLYDAWDRWPGQALPGSMSSFDLVEPLSRLLSIRGAEGVGGGVRE